jgi:hypothetical protein
MSAAPAGDMAYGGNDVDRLGAKVIVVNWDDKLGIDWEDSLLDDQKKQDPMEGLDPKQPLTPGQVVYSTKFWKSFATASDRYLAIPRDVQRTKFTNYETYNYLACTSYNPQHHQINQCTVNYEKRPNPDYKPPNPSTGDYACNGKTLADCIAEAAPVVSQYIYAPVGQTCQLVWVGQCEKYENRTETYPRFEQEYETELTIYRFENGTFTKLDDSLATMTAKNDALAFEYSPLSVKGQISNRNQVQFQNGQLYVFSDQALQTLAVAGNSAAYVNRLDILTNTANNPSVVFSSDRAMISAVEGYTPQQTSNVTMLDLSTPAIPQQLKTFTMPGQSTQLLLANGGILGPGQVSFSNAQVQRTLEKVTLFQNDNGAELDNLLLGTEYNAWETSWFATQDDQRIRLGASGQRMFLPYSGKHHADQYEPTAHRLNITRIENGHLISEHSFDVSDEIIRTAAIDDAHSLVFGDSATYFVDQTSGDWVLSTLREMFVPFATYRLSDTDDLHARIDRVGSKCRVTTVAGFGNIFGDGHLAQVDVPCGEGSLPTGFGTSLLWPDTRTGVKISADGKQIDILSADDVVATLAKIPPQTYCYIEGDKPAFASTGVIDYIDDPPSKILCENVQ